MNANTVVRQFSVWTDWGGGGYKWRAQSNSLLASCRLIEHCGYTWNFSKLKHTPKALSMLDKYWDGLLWHIFSSEVCQRHFREKPVQVNQFWSKTHLSSFLCQHKLWLLSPKEDHVDSFVMYAIFHGYKRTQKIWFGT